MITSLAGTTDPAVASGEHPDDLVLADIPATAGTLSRVRGTVLAWLRGRGIDEDLSQDITLATYEALANGVEHAYGNAAVDTPRLIDLTARHDGPVTIQVTDRGMWATTSEQPHRGRGIPLIRALADDATIETSGNGTEVTMRWGVDTLK